MNWRTSTFQDVTNGRMSNPVHAGDFPMALGLGQLSDVGNLAVRYRQAIRSNVIEWRQRLYMVRVDACPVPTLVVCFQSLRNRAVSFFVLNAVRKPRSVAFGCDSVPTGAQRSLPIPTSGYFVDDVNGRIHAAPMTGYVRAVESPNLVLTENGALRDGGLLSAPTSAQSGRIGVGCLFPRHAAEVTVYVAYRKTLDELTRRLSLRSEWGISTTPTKTNAAWVRANSGIVRLCHFLTSYTGLRCAVPGVFTALPGVSLPSLYQMGGRHGH